MEYNEFIRNVVENIVAAIPEIVAVLTVIIYYLSKIGRTANTFPMTAEKIKTGLTTAFNEAKETLAENVQTSMTQITTDFKGVKQELVDGFNEFKQDVKEVIDTELVELRQRVETLTNQINVLGKENKVFQDVIAMLVGKDPEKVKSGIAQAVKTKLDFSKAELEANPELLLNSKTMEYLESVVGEKNVDNIMWKLGYMRRVGYVKKKKT